MKNKILIITAVLFAIVLTVSIVKVIDRDKIHSAQVARAVAESKVDDAQQHINALQSDSVRYRYVTDSLQERIATSTVLITQYRQKYATIALKYDKERNRIKLLTNDSAVGLFLDRADCTECPVIKYDENYLVPIDPIRFYNDLSVGFDEQVTTNATLRGEIVILDSKVIDQNLLIQEHVKQLEVRHGIIQLQAEQLSQKDVVIGSLNKELKVEKRRAVMYKIGSGIVMVAEVVVIVWVAVGR